LVQVYVVGVGQPLVELLLIWSVRTLYVAVEARRPWLDVDVLDAEIFDMPMEEGLVLMPAVRPDLLDPEGEAAPHMVHEANGSRLRVLGVDPQSTDPCGVVDRGALKAPNAGGL
jgi:hypothetical protein